MPKVPGDPVIPSLAGYKLEGNERGNTLGARRPTPGVDFEGGGKFLRANTPRYN